MAYERRIINSDKPIVNSLVSKILIKNKQQAVIKVTRYRVLAGLSSLVRSLIERI